MGKKRKKIWMVAHLCREINRMVFDNRVTNAQKIKSNFLSILWNWANLCNVVNTNFLAWLGYR